MSLDYDDALNQGMGVILNGILSEFVQDEEKAMTDSAVKARQDYHLLLTEILQHYNQEQAYRIRQSVNAAVLALMVEAMKTGSRYTQPTVEEFCKAVLKGEELEKHE